MEAIVYLQILLLLQAVAPPLCSLQFDDDVSLRMVCLFCCVFAAKICSFSYFKKILKK